MSSIIQISNLTQLHQGRTILDDLTFSVKEGDIFGFVGPNGSGKTSLIRIMTTLLAPTRGEILIDGHSVKSSPGSVRKVMGYVPEICGFYPDMTAWEYLDLFGACYKIHYRERNELISTLFELVDLSNHKDSQVEDLSLGMKQRLSLARALLHDPKVLILDNALTGLDSNTRLEFQELLGELAQMGKTIFLSSHIFSDITRICNQIGIMNAGKLVAYGSIRDLKTQLNLSRTIRIKLLGQQKNIRALLESNPYVSDISIAEVAPEDTHTTIRIKFSRDDEKVVELLAVLTRLGFHVLNFEVDANELEDLFSQITKGAIS